MSTGLARTSAAIRASQVAATVGTVALGAAMAGAAAHAVALGQSAIVASGAIGLLPSAIAQAVGTAIAAKVVFGGLGEAWKQTGAAAVAGGGATVDIARQVELAQRSVRDATAGLAGAQRDALDAQEALARAREDEASRLADLTRSLAGARLSEREAILSVNQAKARMAQVKGGDRNEVEAARLAYQRSLLTLEEVRDRVGDLSKEQAEANEKGVEGSDSVQAAVRRQEDSQRALTQATERLADAQRSLADAGKSVGGGADKAKEALAALAPSAAALVLTMRALGPAWTAAGKAGQQATFDGVAGDMKRLSETYLPMTTTWLGRMGAAFNVAIRETLGLATTAKFAKDVDSTFNAIAATTTALAVAIRPFINGFMQFVFVGSQLLPGIAGEVGGLATRFERWATAARESGRMQEWMTTGLATLKQLGAVATNVVMAIVGVFKAGENTATLDGLVAGSAAMRAWVESAEGQEKVKGVLTFLRNILTDLGQVLPVVMGQADSLSDGFSVLGTIVGFAASHLDTLAKLLPFIAAGFVIAKTAQVAANFAMAVSIPMRALEFVGNWRLTTSLNAHTAALRINTLATATGTTAKGVNTVATTAGDVATKRSIFSMIAARTAMIAGAAATGVVTAAQWLWNIAVSANPIGLIILAVIAFIAIIILLVKYHEEIAAWIGKAWDWIWEKIKAFGNWLWNDLAPMVLNALTWPYRMAWEGIKWVWDKIQQGAAFARDFVIDKLSALVGFVTSLPAKMRAAAANLWDGLKDSFRNAINWLISKWNGFSLTLGGGNVLGMDIPKVTLNTPDIPMLNVGGRVLESGLAVIHRGEEVVPAAEVTSRQRSGGGSISRLIIGSDGSEDGRYLVERLRKAVRSMGGDFDIVFEN